VLVDGVSQDSACCFAYASWMTPSESATCTA
jgi:hypothetical protein